jgi:putative endonuclease
VVAVDTDRTTRGGAGAGRDSARAALGRYGENLAARHLVDAGFSLLARNWRCREGEIDIVARDGDVLVVCEVKTRRDVAFGTPLDAVTPAKAARLRRLAARWLAATREARAVDGGGFADIRFDVVAVLLPRAGAPLVEHLRGAF